MKKLVLIALIAVSFMAAKPANKVDTPMPQCDPCPFVR
jgi:hypothetical protein